ncbi:hypothetical protein [Xenorhabdus indica]|uniref:hypothetical protein n=1 Tax=Xenorhabdus indica TaxID=333964 RepID=UPI001657086A|nr:hypothetical protein [Xenorhabdus indica]MBC8945678.1 N-acetyltransferase [Xenorhabdus indica]MBC8945847.1 N-acetyltransferase [Xenorhabdus indica]
MLKRNSSFNSYIHKTPSGTLSRSNSFHTQPSKNMLNINVNHHNPRLINGYIPIVKKATLQEAEMAVRKLYNSIQQDGWLSHIENTYRRRDNIEAKSNPSTEELWDLRCCITDSLLCTVKDNLSFRIRKKDSTLYQGCNYTYFVCYTTHFPTDSVSSLMVPIGIMLFTYNEDDHYPYYPEVSYLITHPGIQNCAYLLIEKAVNLSYQTGHHGKLKLTTATKHLSNAYNRLGFIDDAPYSMILDPSNSKLWVFSAANGGYRFTGLCP